MRVALLLFLGCFGVSAFGQEKQPDMKFILGEPKDVWERITTLEDSVLDFNTSTVTWPGDNIGQVRFRYIYKKSQPVPGDSKLKYKTQVLILDLDCKGRRWRTRQVHYLDSDEKVIYSEEAVPEVQWKEITGGFAKGGQFTSAGCRLIAKNSGGAIKLGPTPSPPSTPDEKPTLHRRQTEKP